MLSLITKLIIIFSLSINQAYAQNDRQSSFLLGSLEGYPSKVKKVYVTYYLESTSIAFSDSCNVVDNTFSFVNHLDRPAVAFFRTSYDYSQFQIVFIEPGNINLVITGLPFGIKISAGSFTNKVYDTLLAQREEVYNKFAREIAESKTNNNVDLSPFYTEINDIDYAFFKTHPSSIITGFFLQPHYRRLTPEQLLQYYSSMDAGAKENFYGKRLKDEIEERVKPVFRKAPNFTAVTMTGSDIKLADFSGKFVVLDFWATWCVPCREAAPLLKEKFNKYHGKGFEVIAIASDDNNKTGWLSAIREDGTGIWHNILDGKLYGKDRLPDITNSLSKIYNVGVLPTKILIDKNGYIIGKYEGLDAEVLLYEKLQAIFGKYAIDWKAF